MFKTLKQRIIARKIKKGLNDIAESEIFIAFYESQKDGMTDEKEIAGMDIKIGQLKQAIETNLKFIDYAKKL